MADGGSDEEQAVDAVLTNLWRSVVNAVNRLLEADGKFGFSKIEANLNPSIEDISHGLGIVEIVLNLVLDSNLLNHDQKRTAYNSKQCIIDIRLLSDAIKSKDQSEYDRIIRALNLQAKF